MWEKEKMHRKKRGTKPFHMQMKKKGNSNKPGKDISQTKFHHGRSYYGKELIQESRRLDHIFRVNE